MTVRPGSEMGARVTVATLSVDERQPPAGTQHFAAASVVTGMNDSMLMLARTRRGDLARDAGRARRAARVRRSRLTPRPAQATTETKARAAATTATARLAP